MKSIIIAAGLGRRLNPLTKTRPKSLLPIGKQTILERQINIYKSLGIRNINIIVGYKKNKFEPKFGKFIFNKDYKNNNILESLFCAQRQIKGNCLISYSDILFKKSVVEKLLKSKKAISIVVDTDWQKAYRGRKMHPKSQAEKALFDKKNILLKTGKHLQLKDSNSEFIGMLKLNKLGSKIFLKYYKIAKKKYKNNFFNAQKFKKAYLTDFFLYLISQKVKISCVKISGNWMEIDTIEDYKKAMRIFN